MNIRYPIYEGVYRILTLSPAYLLSNGKRAGGRVGADLVVSFRPFCFLYI